MRTKVNGTETVLRKTKTIAALVEEITGSSERRGIAVARNGEIVRQDDWSQAIEDGDEIEVVHAVQGG